MEDRRLNTKQYLGRDPYFTKNDVAKKKSGVDVVLLVVGAMFLLVAFTSLHYLYAVKLPVFSQDMLSAALGAVLTVAAMALIMRMQSRSETEKDFLGSLFNDKLNMYSDFLSSAFESDDDNILDKDEISVLENKAGTISLIASRELVGVLSQFIFQLKTFGCMYERSLTQIQRNSFVDMVKSGELKLALSKRIQKEFPENNDLNQNLEWYFVTLDDLVQAMRKDLSVVDGNIRSMIDNFVSPKYDHKKMIKDPNFVDDPDSKAA